MFGGVRQRYSSSVSIWLLVPSCRCLVDSLVENREMIIVACSVRVEKKEFFCSWICLNFIEGIHAFLFSFNEHWASEWETEPDLHAQEKPITYLMEPYTSWAVEYCRYDAIVAINKCRTFFSTFSFSLYLFLFILLPHISMSVPLYVCVCSVCDEGEKIVSSDSF